MYKDIVLLDRMCFIDDIDKIDDDNMIRLLASMRQLSILDMEVNNNDT